DVHEPPVFDTGGSRMSGGTPLVTASLAGRRLAILGFGNQGAAHAELLRGRGVEVVVGARTSGNGAPRARAAGFDVRELADALAGADVIALLLPDEVLPALWPALAPSVRAGQTFVFAHGFNLLYGGVAFPPGADVVLVSPTAPGNAMPAMRAAG